MKIYILLSIILLTACKTEGKQTDNGHNSRISSIIVRDLMDGSHHQTFVAMPTQVNETVYNLKNDGSPRDTLHYIYHLKNSLLESVEANEVSIKYVNTFHYDAQHRITTMLSKEVNGEQLRKFIIEYNEEGLLHKYTDYLGNELDEIYTYQISPSGDVLVGMSNYGAYDKYIFGVYRDSLFRVQESTYTPENISLYGGIRIFDNHNQVVERYADAKNFEKKYVLTYDTHHNLIANIPNEAQRAPTSIDQFGNVVPAAPVHWHRYKYVYDDKGNWTERLSYLDNVLYSRSVRTFKY